MSKCKHTRTEYTETRGYVGGVAVEPYTYPNRDAHGCVCKTEECRECGATRQVLVNRGSREYSPWSAQAKQLSAAEKKESRSYTISNCAGGDAREFHLVGGKITKASIKWALDIGFAGPMFSGPAGPEAKEQFEEWDRANDEA